jgi:hypothetical protein
MGQNTRNTQDCTLRCSAFNVCLELGSERSLKSSNRLSKYDV